MNIYLNDEQIEDAKLFQIIGSKDKAVAKAAADNAVKEWNKWYSLELSKIQSKLLHLWQTKKHIDAQDIQLVINMAVDNSNLALKELANKGGDASQEIKDKVNTG